MDDEQLTVTARLVKYIYHMESKTQMAQIKKMQHYDLLLQNKLFFTIHQVIHMYVTFSGNYDGVHLYSLPS